MKLEPLPTILIIFFLSVLFLTFTGREYNVYYEEAPVLEAQNISYFVKNKTLADQMDEFDIELYDLAYKIAVCESGFDSTAQNPYSSAYGIGQFLDGTWVYIQNKWGVELDRYSESDQMYALIRLLQEEGVTHWLESKSCWDKDNKY